MSREPSMEEILSSIRRVIARDEAARDDALEARFGSGDADKAVESSDATDDILELSQFENDTDAVEDGIDGSEPMTCAEPAVAVQEAPAPVLVSTDSADAARQSIEQLTAALAPPLGAGDAPVVGAGMTIEQLAEAALRPMLKQWLDANLPPLVERLVAREIARITGGRI